MSYILDALRRADAERERDPGRGIHAQPAALPAETGRRIPWWIAAVVAALALLVAGALLLRPAPRVSLDLGMPPPNAPLSKGQPAAPAAMPVAAQVIPPAPATVATEVSPPAPPPVAAEVSPTAPERPLERAVVKAPVAPAAAAPGAPVAAAPARATAPVVPARAAAAATMPAATPSTTPAPPAAPPTAAATAAERILAPSELPPEVQRELPKLNISGGVHSDNPAQRMLIVGGQVISEGAEAAPGVLVEQIRPKSAVLKFRGWRYSVQY